MVWAGPKQAERKMAIMQMWIRIIHGAFCYTQCCSFSFWAHWVGGNLRVAK